MSWPDGYGTGRAIIHEVLPRWSRISRGAAGNPTEEQVLAANVDTAFIVTSEHSNLFKTLTIHSHVLSGSSDQIRQYSVTGIGINS